LLFIDNFLKVSGMSENYNFLVTVWQNLFLPLAGLGLLLLVIPFALNRRWFKKQINGQSGFDFDKKIEAVYKRSAHLYNAEILVRKAVELQPDHRGQVLTAWQHLDSALRQIAETYLLVNAASDPYPIDYVLFELEQRQKVSNTVCGMYRELSQLMSLLCEQSGMIPGAQAVLHFVQLAGLLMDKMQDDSMLSKRSLF